MSRSFSMSPWSKNSSATFFASWCCSSHGLAMADTSQAVINMPQRTAEKREMLLRLFPHVTFSSKTPQPTDACTQGLCVWYVHVRTLRLIPLHYKVLFFCWSSHNWIIPILFSGAYIVLIVGSTLLTYSHLLISLMCCVCRCLLLWGICLDTLAYISKCVLLFLQRWISYNPCLCLPSKAASFTDIKMIKPNLLICNL